MDVQVVNNGRSSKLSVTVDRETSQSYQMSITGSYEEAMDYMDSLYQIYSIDTVLIESEVFDADTNHIEMVVRVFDK